MKNTDPPDSKSHKLSLSPELRRFVESMGSYFENEGVPRIGGRILGLLLIAHEPLRPEDLASVLKVSRASISTNIRMLTNSSLVEKVTFLHDRYTYFTITDDVWQRAIIAGREKVLAFRAIAAMGLEVLPGGDKVARRLEEMVEWADMLAETYEQVLEAWRARHPEPAREVSRT